MHVTEVGNGIPQSAGCFGDNICSWLPRSVNVGAAESGETGGLGSPMEELQAAAKQLLYTQSLGSVPLKMTGSSQGKTRRLDGISHLKNGLECALPSHSTSTVSLELRG